MSTKQRRFQKPGLWFSTLRSEVEAVKKAHRKECVTCGHMPELLRLKVIKGAGRHQTTMIFCVECGAAWIDAFKALAHRAKAYLTGGMLKLGSIREPV